MEGLERFLEKIRHGEIPFGIFITMSDMAVSEMAGYAGYDFVWIDAEHAPLDRQEIYRHILAAQSAGAAAFVRIPGADIYRVKAILDMGPDGIIFPFVESREVAERAMKACFYPPDGVRGQGPIRAIRYGIESERDYIRDHKKRCLRICQIENLAGYEHLDEIMEVEGIDSLFIGAADLGRSVAGRFPDGGQEMSRIYNELCRRIREKGILLGAAGGTTRESIQAMLDQGVQWAVCGQDVRFLSGAMVQSLKDLRGEKP